MAARALLTARRIVEATADSLNIPLFATMLWSGRRQRHRESPEPTLRPGSPEALRVRVYKVGKLKWQGRGIRAIARELKMLPSSV